jgi:sensor histidine kinase regulating citrate/malate metabolism
MQLFQRSFSTKGTGRGIGTYSMKLFGEKYLEGRVDFESTRENGTTFFIEI